MRFVTSERLAGCALILAAVGFAGACTATTDLDNHSPCTGAAPLAVHISPLDPSATVGNGVRLSALLRCGDNGQTISTNWIWSSANPGVVSVDANGLATGVSRGTTIVTATSARYPDVAASVGVRAIVISAFVPTIEPPSVIMAPGTVTRFRATVSEEPNGHIMWSIDRPEIATVDPTGLVRAHLCGLAGNAVVTARDADDATLSVSAALTVRPLLSDPLAIQSVRDSISGEPTDFNHVRGTVVIRLNLDGRMIECGELGGLQLALKSVSGNEVVLPGTPPPPGESATDLDLDTAARDLEGKPRTPNGSFTLAARVFNAQGRLIAETPGIPVTVDNP